MYNHFFGFKEKPFKLVPNPEYLYLSKIHEEVLAHLNYAEGYGEGFVEITGEVGTGKTTLCRMFLENLNKNTEAAYIFNPKLNAVQLLKAINDEFGLSSNTESVKTLIDRLNRFLLEKKAENKQVLLLVDEAQNLSVDVLEQLRLLSNLETTTSKLLQIILVGQPELGELLETERLRQLHQRIALRCQLVPLNAKETREYIRHRIHIASRKPGLGFTPRAHRAIFNYSGGVPRRINIACDRVLLTAYSIGKHSISHSIVKKALRELGNPRNPGRKAGLFWEKWIVGLLLILVGLVLALVVSQTYTGSRSNRSDATVSENNAAVGTAPETDSVQLGEKKVPAKEISPLPSPPPPSISESFPGTTAGTATPGFDIQPSPRGIEQWIASTDALDSRVTALGAVLRLWMQDAPVIGAMEGVDNKSFFQISARRNEMESLRVRGGLNIVKALNVPAILEFPRPGKSGSRFAAIVAFEENTVWLSDGSEPFSISPSSLTAWWDGVAYILWKNFFNYTGVIPTSSPGDVIVSLKVHLKRLGFTVEKMNAAYDSATHRAVETIQRRNGLQVDGIVGPMTKIVLYNEDRLLDIPRLADMPGR